MTVMLPCGERAGTIPAPPSKSCLHRLAFLAALGKVPVRFEARGIPEDVWSTVNVLRCLGCEIFSDAERLTVGPLPESYGETEMPLLPVGESGTTLRFLLPFAGRLGLRCGIRRSGSLIGRPVGALAAELGRHGMKLREAGEYLLLEGQLQPGSFTLPGNISSQYISALLLTLPCLPGDSLLQVKGKPGSAAYIALTQALLQKAGIEIHEESPEEGPLYRIPGGQKPQLPARLLPEGDWSGAAAFLAMGAFSRTGVCVTGLDRDSLQPDRQILSLLRSMGAQVTESRDGIRVKAEGPLRPAAFDADTAPDLVPVLAALAAFAGGESRISGTGRLRLKESDRLAGVMRLLETAGIACRTEEDVLTISGGKPKSGGTAVTAGDHRMAMAAAVLAAGLPKGDTIGIDNALCVGKSFPDFWRKDKGLRR